MQRRVEPIDGWELSHKMALLPNRAYVMTLPTTIVQLGPLQLTHGQIRVSLLLEMVFTEARCLGFQKWRRGEAWQADATVWAKSGRNRHNLACQLPYAPRQR